VIHLHLHSHYSVLDGLGKPEDIVARAKAMKASAVAITDHASITAMPELFKHAEEAGIKPIIGCEFYVTDLIEPAKGEKRYHLTVLAKSWQGVESMMAKLTLANQQYYYRPRLTFDQVMDFHDCIVMSGCSAGILSHDQWDKISDVLRCAYGDDFYLEIMPHSIEHDGVNAQEIINNRAIEANERYDINLVATNDAHYVNREDFQTHEILLAVQTGKKWDDPERWSWNAEAFYMRDVAEMIEAFRANCPYLPIEKVGEALRNTVAIANKCDVKIPKFEVHLPSLYSNDDEVFARLITDGWKHKLVSVLKPEEVKTYHDRLIYEVGVIKKLGFTRYFLMVEDIIRTSRSKGIMVGPARGSAAGSLVCYLMNITQVDPIKHGLYFERFLNPERIDLPDIDTDFQDDRRGEVFDYIRNKFGADYTANINTVTQLGMSSAFRDVARTFGVDMFAVNMLSKLIQDEDSFEIEPELIKFVNKDDKNRYIVEQAKKLVGTIRGNGVHACGFIVSSHKLENVSVIERRKDSQVVNWDMRLCESFGLVKMDVLGLSTLTVLDKAIKLIERHRGITIDLTKIPLTDEDTLQAFSRGEGAGIFQFENSGMQDLLKALKANTFEMITDTTALYRPGSLESGETERYVQVAQGHRYEDYLCEHLRPILSQTKGVMIYQEQIMQIFVQLGGFTWAEADKMRKIVGKKLGADAFNEHKSHFVEGCLKNGIDANVSETIFAKMVEFAKYSFNLSHAVAYTMISFWTMYLKVHFMVEFFAACLTTRQEKVIEIVRDARRLGIKVINPDINLSTGEYEIIDHEEKIILSPLGVIKGIGPKCVETILNGRNAGPFMSAEDFAGRVSSRTCNKTHKTYLERAGAFESLGIREPSIQEREKNYAELLPIFDTLPTIVKTGEEFDKEAVTGLFKDMVFCARDNKLELMMPSTGPAPYIVVVNNPVKSEKKHLTNAGTRHFLTIAEGYGISPAAFYYTGAVKCNHNGKTPSKKCLGKCSDFLKAEIKLVKPKLIICFATNMVGLFSNEKKPSMGKLCGQVAYNKEFGCYVLFSYSPQYAYYNEDKAPQFEEAIGKLKEIFN